MPTATAEPSEHAAMDQGCDTDSTQGSITPPSVIPPSPVDVLQVMDRFEKQQPSHKTKLTSAKGLALLSKLRTLKRTKHTSSTPVAAPAKPRITVAVEVLPLFRYVTIALPLDGGELFGWEVDGQALPLTGPASAKKGDWCEFVLDTDGKQVGVQPVPMQTEAVAAAQAAFRRQVKELSPDTDAPRPVQTEPAMQPTETGASALDPTKTDSAVQSADAGAGALL